MIMKLLIPATLAAGLCVPVAFKGGFHGGAGQMPSAFLESKLKLSTDQKSAIHEVFKRHKPAFATRMETLVQARNAALDAGLDPTVTPEAWRTQQEQMANAIYEMAKEIGRAHV